MNSNNSIHDGLAAARIYTNFDGLSKLRAQAAQQSPEAKKEVAQQFEALFLQMMLKSMRQASQLGESTDSEQTRFYQEMFDKQVALDLASRQGIGLASILEDQLGGSPSSDMTRAKPQNLPASHGAGIVLDHFRLIQDQFIQSTLQSDVSTRDKVTQQKQLPRIESAPPGLVHDIKQKWMPDSPESFIRDLWPHVSQGAQALRVLPEVLIAQAALETGWGRKVIKNQDGQSTLNLFGIKADNRWQGDRVLVSTLEYRDGITQQEYATFRSYASLSESIDDYVSFLEDSPRYQHALVKTRNANKFLQELQDAGYATDPAYAKKINSIMRSDSFTQTVAQLRDSS